jgi:hypothetical protein
MKTTLLLLIINLTLSCTQLFGQLDSTYTYTFNCPGCGTYETVSFEPIDLQTQASVTDLILPDSANVSLAQFSSSMLRKPKPFLKNNIRFNIYPNPVKDIFYLNFEATYPDISIIKIIDIYGRTIDNMEVSLNEGENIIENKISGYSSGIYFINVNFNNNTFTRKINLIK